MGCTAVFFGFRHVANGEILSVSLLMEDVLSLGLQERAMKRALRDAEDSEDADTDGENLFFYETDGENFPQASGANPLKEYKKHV